MGSHEICDVEYVRHGDVGLLARIFQPQGLGPFPALVMLHGGAWTVSDRTKEPVCGPLAAAGILVVSLDFRMPPVASYPASIADANAGVRWLKLHAHEYGTRPAAIGLIGTSSGAHMAVLVAMRPDDPRYGATAVSGAGEIDASVGFVVACWPPIDPLGRYQYLKGHDPGVGLSKDVMIESHDRYWGNEGAMSEGSPLRILERGERVAHPDILYVQATEDRFHPPAHRERFVELYRDSGGRVDVELADFTYEGHPRGDVALSAITAFVRAHTDAALRA